MDITNLPDGIYFDLPETTYHALQRFSSSGVKDMLESESDYWENSWMNPDKEHNDDDTKAKLWGRAYHCRLNEGKDALAARYFFDLDPSVYGDGKIFYTGNDAEAELKSMGVAGLSKMKAAEKLAMLKLHLPEAIIWDDEVKRHDKLNEGKTKIPREWVMRIERAAAFIENDPPIAACFRGGCAEVTVLWTKVIELADGSGRKMRVPMKARLDYLKFVRKVKTRDGVFDFLTCTDLKNFMNGLGKRLGPAIVAAAAAQKLHIQCATYYEALEHFVEFMQIGRWWDYADGGVVEQSVMKDGPAPMFEGLTHDATPIMNYVFQKSTGAPVARMKPMPKSMRVVDIGRLDLDQSCEKYAKCMATFGTELWIVPGEVEEFEDEQMPIYMTE